MEIFKENQTGQEIQKKEEKIPTTKKYVPNIFEGLPLVRDLPETSSAWKFCTNRKLPIDTFDFYYAVDFIAWTKNHTDKFESCRGPDHGRVIIPWHDRDHKIIGYSARDVGGEQEQKYYRILVDENVKERFFGLDRLDDTKKHYVLEGEIDSLMIPNAIAVANGKLHTYRHPNAVYIPDADVRNKHIMRNVKDMVELDLKVAFMPPDLPGKDLNELVQAGWTSDDILDVVDRNTYERLNAMLVFNNWKVTT